MPTIGLIEVTTPKMTITTSTTDTGDLFGNWPTSGEIYSFPFPGTVKKIIINNLPGIDMNGSQFELLKYAGSVGGAIPLGILNLVGGNGLKEFIVDYLFDANDGFQYSMGGSAGALFQVILEIEYDLI